MTRLRIRLRQWRYRGARRVASGLRTDYVYAMLGAALVAGLVAALTLLLT